MQGMRTPAPEGVAAEEHHDDKLPSGFGRVGALYPHSLGRRARAPANAQAVGLDPRGVEIIGALANRARLKHKEVNSGRRAYPIPPCATLYLMAGLVVFRMARELDSY